MNNQSVTLLSILSKCNPQDETLSRESKLEEIFHSPEYIELSKRTVFSNQFEELFAPNKLRTYSSKQLYNVKRVLPLIPNVLENLLYSLQNGAAPSLTRKDVPDFLDKDSLERIASKLQNSTGKNFCNIMPNDFMAIFDKDTIKCMNDDFYDLSANCTNYEAEISKMYAGKKYCISSQEIQLKEKEYLEKIERLQAEINSAKNKKSSRRFVKFMLGIIGISIPSLFGGLTGLLSTSAVSLVMLFILLVTLVFWIGG